MKELDSLTPYLKNIWLYSSMPLFEISGNKISILSLLLALTVFFLSLSLSKMAGKFMKRVLSEKGIDAGVKGSIITITRYLVLTIGIFITLDTVGISLSSLAALGAVLMVGIGFGLQNIAQNFISGLILLLERPIKEGDLVEVKGISGKVISIGARSTLINTRDDVSIIVPNSQFISEQVVNESFSGNRVRLHVDISCAYGSDTDLVKEVLLSVANNHEKVLKDPSPNVLFQNFGESSLDFKLLIWVDDLWDYLQTLSEIRFAINREFLKENITIPFPQRDVYIHNKEL
jgi:small-conductance mechanosensitive channel